MQKISLSFGNNLHRAAANCLSGLLGLLAAFVFLLVSSATASASFAIDTSGTSMTGLWGNQNESGWGTAITHEYGMIFVTIYTYDASGNPVWYVVSSCPVSADRCAGTLYSVKGGSSLTDPWNGANKVVAEAGTLNLVFTDANTGTMTYTINGVSGSKAITRQIFATGATPSASDYSGLWGIASESGWGIALTRQVDMTFATIYTYDSNGNPKWYVASSCPMAANGCSGTLYSVTGGSPLTSTWNGANKVVTSVGTLNLAFADANTGSMSFTLNGISSSKTIARQIFANPPASGPVAGTQMGGAIQGTALALNAAVTTLAGTGVATAAGATIDATGIAASFVSVQGITTDGSNLYVADTTDNKIRKIEIATGIVTTLAGSGIEGAVDATGIAASFALPAGITTDGSNLYVADQFNNKIRKIVIATGNVTTLAGSGTVGAVDATGSAASFSYPFGITTDGSNLYVADTGNHKIRKIVIATGNVTTLAGSGTPGAVDTTGSAAKFLTPKGITTDGSNLYVVDTGGRRIRKIVIATGAVTTLAGTGASGAVDATGIAASFNLPIGITTDGTNLYVADTINNKIRRIVIATGEVTTIAGSGASDGLDATGSAASFNYPYGITTDGRNLYVADTGNHKIRKIQ